MEKFFELYKEVFKTEPHNILEIGSRDGNDAETLRQIANIQPENVHIIEPHPDSAKNIRNHHPLFKVYELAIFNKMGILPFNAIPETFEAAAVGTSSLLPRNGDFLKSGNFHNPQRWVNVVSITGQMLLQLINEPNIDLVKVDVEGATYEVLSSFGDDIRLLKALHIETEHVKMWDTKYTDLDVHKLLSYYQFEKIYSNRVYNTQEDSIWVRRD